MLKKVFRTYCLENKSSVTHLWDSEKRPFQLGEQGFEHWALCPFVNYLLSLASG